MSLATRLVPLITGFAVLFLAAGCIFGGGGKPQPAISRPGSIPTATPPANLPVPILLGQSQVTGAAPVAGAGAANTYTLQSGDTLFSVAAKLGVPGDQQGQWVAEVLRLNGLADATLLKSGQELTLPKLQATPRPTGTVQATVAARTPTPPAPATSTSRPTAAATQAPPTPTPPAAATGGTYTVVAGDSPVSIASKLGVPVPQQQAWADQLLSLNGISASGLQVGQVLQLPKTQ